MKKAFGIVAATALAIAAVSAPAAAAKPVGETADVLSGKDCKKAGMTVLRTATDTNLIPFVAKNGLNVTITAPGEAPVSTNLSLSEVLAAHRAAPSLFAGGVVAIDDLGGLDATWCAKP